MRRFRLPRSKQRPFAACTIVTRNFLSYARVLGESYLEHHPGSRFYVLVVDGLPPGVQAGDGIEVVEAEELALPYLEELFFKYDVTELCTAVKPTFLAKLLEREEAVVYLDPDILVMRPFVELGQALRSANIVLTPHVLRPIPPDGLRPNEQDMLISGAYNLGFLGLARSADADELLDWWEERLRDGCRIDVPSGLFTDQKWIDLVPGLFASATILRDDTYNVAFWNLHERTIERRGPVFLTNGRPIAFFHFSGFDSRRPDVLSKHQTRTQLVQGTALAELVNLYVDLQLRNGYATCSEWEYGYSRFDNGIAVNTALRKLYLGLPDDERARFGDPFKTSGPDAFLEWAIRPTPSGLSRFLETLYRLRVDLLTAYPDPHGRDHEAYLRWARIHGSREMGFEPELVRDGDGTRVPPGSQHEGRSGAEPPANGNGGYRRLVGRVRLVVDRVVPQGATVIVVSKGDDELLALEGRRGWHFPQNGDSTWAGYYPSDGTTATAHLESLRDRGGDFFVLPSTAFWWFDYYPEFRDHLARTARRLWLDDSCAIYALRSDERRRAS